MPSTGYLLVVRERELSNTDHFVSYNLIRVFATVSVVVVHATITAVINGVPGKSMLWLVGNAVESIARTGIPLFLMLTGALLLPKAESGITFITKRYKRIFIPFFFWSAVYLVAKFPIKELRIQDVANVLLYGASYQFWYVYVVAGIYLLMPFIKPFLEKTDPGLLKWLFVIWLTCFTIPFFIKEGIVLTTNQFILYSGYVATGYILSDFLRKKRLTGKQRIIAYAAFAGGTLLTFAGTHFLSLKEGRLITTFYESTMPHIFLKAVGTFVLLFDLAVLLSAKAAKLVNWMSKYSFGVFMVHPLVLDHILVSRLGITTSYMHPIVGIFLSSFLGLGISYLLIYLLSRLPFGKYSY
ncbi:acyltransferase [Pontibacter ruber]|uniref:Acyltransferase n=1 Tax=Pontibacter ruber TaxID=1343895 RepID=A0ABW5CSA2_9BACT|nr:acyltransferase family protein [Pontibacter ruber]